MASVLATTFSAIYGIMGVLSLVAPHMLFTMFAHFPGTVDKMGWYYLEPLVRCNGLMSLALAMALMCIAHSAKTTTDQSISKCSCQTVAAILATRGIGDAVLAYMYPELRTFATYAMIVLHHLAVGSEVLCMMGQAAKNKVTATTEKDKDKGKTQ